MKFIKNIKWCNPLDYIKRLNSYSQDFILLNSCYNNEYTGRYSYIAYDPTDKVISNDFDQLSCKLSINKPNIENAWFGYLGYDLKNSLENIKLDEEYYIKTDDLYFVKFKTIIIFDHKIQNISVHSVDNNFKEITEKQYLETSPDMKISDFQSNMSVDQYLKNVTKIKQLIAEGTLYQANLTRKFFGNIENHNPIEIFLSLCKVSPSPYSAIMKLGDKYIISSSPESFLNIDSKKNITTRPIKGTAKKYSDKVKDQESKENLINSMKDKSENLMITDLSRNDLSRSCEIGSVKTKNLFEVTSYKNIHHMSSTITGKIKDKISTLQAVQNCFPPGSMTGAPKIKAMQICSDLEQIRRGIYSGALGWFGGDGSCDLSVTIRTIILQNNKFEFQVGGAIIYDSDPQSELQETVNKASAICKVLGI